MSSVINVTQVHYPESDGKPMGETDEHRDAIVRHIELLRYHFRNQRVYVSGDLLVYYEQGIPRKFVVPDAFVVKDIDPRKRRVYKIWAEGKGPDAVIETTSRKTRRKDTQTKPAIYARLGVKEYFLFDPDQEYLDPPLQGHRLVGDTYVKIDPDETGALVSEELGLRLRVQQGQLMMYRLDTGERLLTGQEVRERAEEAVQAAEDRRQKAEEARRAAEAEAARLREELSRRQ